MRSKAEIIRRELKGLRVLDIGGVGYGDSNAYERDLAEAWNMCKSRTTVDCSERADLCVDFNGPLPDVAGDDYDVTTAFGILEHVERPAELLRWIPTRTLIVNFPNAQSGVARLMEERNGSKHLYSFTPYTASILLGEGGWGITDFEYTFGKWSLRARILNRLGSVYPRSSATDFVYFCDRDAARKQWSLL